MLRIRQVHKSKAMLLVLPLLLAACKGEVDGDGCKTEVITLAAKDASIGKQRSKLKITEFKDAKTEKMEGNVIFKDISTVCKKQEKKAPPVDPNAPPKKPEKAKKSNKPVPPPRFDCEIKITYCPKPVEPTP